MLLYLCLPLPIIGSINSLSSNGGLADYGHIRAPAEPGGAFPTSLLINCPGGASRWTAVAARNSSRNRTPVAADTAWVDWLSATSFSATSFSAHLREEAATVSASRLSSPPPPPAKGPNPPLLRHRSSPGRS
ncbi:hypothetical protein KIL84_005895 [Mauremys mutica]|uniref:Uncharacterized protein n=1 Tax=Mauremys mutica TaxID=74926 RepID=A0A9D3XIN0_9SAUR|nr:hypothetical protein KIL84_005895 [Mauremys mutica]